MSTTPLSSVHRAERPSIAQITAAFLTAVLFSAHTAAVAGPVEDGVQELQRDWEVINYQVPAPDREKRFEALAQKAHRLTEANPQRAEPLVWEGIIVSSWAGAKGGLGALGLVKQARSMYESAIAIDGNVLDGSAYNSLGVLYYKVPGWPVGFGDKDKARELLKRALNLNPRGIDPNFFYADYLVTTGQPAEAAVYLERALSAPSRPGRAVADAGRREESRQLLEKVRERSASR